MAKIVHFVDYSQNTQYAFLPSEPLFKLRDRAPWLKKQRFWCKTEINGFESPMNHTN